MHVMCDAKCTRRWFRHSNQTQEASTSPYTYTGLFPKYVQVRQTHKFVAMWDMAHVCCIRLLKPFSLHFFCGHLPLSFIKIVFLCIQTSMKTCNFFKSRPKGRKGRKHKAAQSCWYTSVSARKIRIQLHVAADLRSLCLSLCPLDDSSNSVPSLLSLSLYVHMYFCFLLVFLIMHTYIYRSLHPSVCYTSSTWNHW